MSFTCSCSKEFCIKCRYPEEHSCLFDYKSREKERLKKNNPLVMKPKVEELPSINIDSVISEKNFIKNIIENIFADENELPDLEDY